MNPVNKERRAKAYARNYGDRADYVRDMNCRILPLHKLLDRVTCSGRIQAAHVKARGMGGCKGDRRDLLNLCAAHHKEAGERRTSQRAAFEEKWGIDLEDEAKKLAEWLDGLGFT